MLRICLDCTASYAVGLKLCPQCWSERAVDQDADPYRGGTEPMPKITRLGGPSDAADIPQVSTEDSSGEGGEQSSPTPEGPGDSSSRSETKPSSTPKTSSSGDSKRARTTGNRTGRAGTGSSTARTTDTAPTAATSKTTAPDKD